VLETVANSSVYMQSWDQCRNGESNTPYAEFLWGLKEQTRSIVLLGLLLCSFPTRSMTSRKNNRFEILNGYARASNAVNATIGTPRPI